MKPFPTFLLARVFLGLMAWLSLSSIVQAQSIPNWEAFNDYSSSALTSPNATGYKLRTAGDYGPLRNFETADDLAVTVSVENEGGTPDDFGARGGALDAASPSRKLFDGKVDLANDGIVGVRATVKLILVFSGLDPTKVYKFCGTAARGGSYNNRWSVFSLVGVGNFVSAHVDGSVNKNIFTAQTFPAAAGSLEANQVALNAGHNKAGSLVCWDKIEPSPEGTIRIEALRYLGPTPFGDAPNAGTSYSYGFEAMYLAEYESTGDLHITENPTSQKVPAGKTATLTVGATSSRAIIYQWQKQAPGEASFSNINGANAASYTTPVLAVSDDGTLYRCALTSGPDHATSGEATLTVDGVIPTVTAATGSVNFNSVYVSFSEPMKLDQLADPGKYGLDGGLVVNSAVALNSTSVRLLTSAQNSGTKYTVTANDIEDLAGNRIPANSKKEFTGFAIVKGAVGLEIWYNIGGGAVNDLRSNARYPLDPDLDLVTTALDSYLAIPAVPDINTYGGRFRAWITPSESGEYDFFLRADDTGELRLNQVDDSFEQIDDPNLNTPIAVDSTGGDPFQEPGIDGSTTAQPIFLEAGHKYAIQAIWKEANGPDYLQVAWRLAGDPTPAAELLPIPTEFFSYYGPPSLPKITKVALESGKVIIEWSGAALESSADLKTWKEEMGATSPFSVTPVGHKFYRAKN